jgi:hypothetical protein
MGGGENQQAIFRIGFGWLENEFAVFVGRRWRQGIGHFIFPAR